MCYIYAKKVIDVHDCEVSWANTFYELVTECVMLLLRDLDEEKVRGLPKAQREALLRRRNAYLAEKDSFLKYFAFSLYFGDKVIFDLEYLKRAITHFFMNCSSFESKERLLSELERTDVSYPNFALQLIFSGVFVSVDRSSGKVLYDFPHRRFREVLACEYITTPERFQSLLLEIDKPQFSEFRTVFSKSPRCHDRTLQIQTLEAILARARSEGPSHYCVRMSKSLLDLVGPNELFSKIISDFLREMVRIPQPRFTLSKKVLEYYTPGDDFVELLVGGFRASLSKMDFHPLSLCVELLAYYYSGVLRELLRSEAVLGVKDRRAASVLVTQMLVLKHEVLQSFISKSRQNSEILMVAFYRLAKLLDTLADSEEYWSALFKSLTGLEKRHAFYFVYKYARKAYQSCQTLSGFPIFAEVYSLVFAKQARQKWSESVSISKPETLFFFGGSLVERVVSMIPDVLVLSTTVDRSASGGLERETEYLKARVDRARITDYARQTIAIIQYSPFARKEELDDAFMQSFYIGFENLIDKLDFKIQRGARRGSDQKEKNVKVVKDEVRRLKDTEVLDIEASVFAELLEVVSRIERNFVPEDSPMYFE